MRGGERGFYPLVPSCFLLQLLAFCAKEVNARARLTEAVTRKRCVFRGGEKKEGQWARRRMASGNMDGTLRWRLTDCASTLSQQAHECIVLSVSLALSLSLSAVADWLVGFIRFLHWPKAYVSQDVSALVTSSA